MTILNMQHTLAPFLIRARSNKGGGKKKKKERKARAKTETDRDGEKEGGRLGEQQEGGR